MKKKVISSSSRTRTRVRPNQPQIKPNQESKVKSCCGAKRRITE